MKLAIALDREALGPGDPVTGSVRVEQGGGCRRLLVELVFAERSDKYEGATIRVEHPVLHVGDLVAGLEFPFALQLPDEALPNVRSAHGSLTWVVRARCDRAGFDHVQDCPLELLEPPAHEGRRARGRPAPGGDDGA